VRGREFCTFREGKDDEEGGGARGRRENVLHLLNRDDDVNRMTKGQPIKAETSFYPVLKFVSLFLSSSPTYVVL
jgi:hypothetical protein